MDLVRLEKRVKSDEGYRDLAYKDTVDVWTLGFGSTRMFGEPIKEGDTCTANQAQTQLRADLFGAIINARALFPRFNDMDSVRQEILVNMAFNMGPTRLAGFKKLIAAANELNYTEMAKEMVDSRWYKQVGGRGQRLVAAMKTGKWTEAS